MSGAPRAARILTAAALLASAAAAAVLQERALAWQRVQRHVEDAALKGAEAIAAGGDVEAAVRRRLRERQLLRGADSVAIERPTPDGRFAGHPAVVRVTLSTEGRSFLLPSRLERRFRIRAAAAVVPPELAGGGRAFIRVE